jgi:hypothetical protein
LRFLKSKLVENTLPLEIEVNGTSTKSPLTRRSFLHGGLAAGTGAGFFRTVSATADPCLGSASDAIVLLLDLLFNVQDEAYVEAGKKLRAASVLCADTLQSLYDEIDKLAKRITPQKSSSVTMQRMSELLEFGRTNIRLVKNSTISSAHAFASLAMINQEVSNAAQDLLPLDDEARRILKRIIDISHKAREVPEVTRQAQRDYDAQIQIIRANFQAVRAAIFAAATAAEHDVKTTATEQIEHAIKALNTIPANRGSSVRIPAATIMVQCLEGARTWVNNGPRSIPIFFDESEKKVKANPNAKKHHSPFDNAFRGRFGAMTISSQGVSGLLSGLCLPDNLSRRGACYWAAGMAWLRHPQYFEGRVFLIAGALTRFPCDPGSAKDSLIKALAGG